jgi:hypothetical protein
MFNNIYYITFQLFKAAVIGWEILYFWHFWPTKILSLTKMWDVPTCGQVVDIIFNDTMVSIFTFVIFTSTQSRVFHTGSYTFTTCTLRYDVRSSHSIATDIHIYYVYSQHLNSLNLPAPHISYAVRLWALLVNYSICPPPKPLNSPSSKELTTQPGPTTYSPHYSQNTYGW